MNLPRSASLAALVVLLVACGSQPAVELDVAPAGAPDETSDAPEQPEPATEAPATEDPATSDDEGAGEPAPEPPATTPDAGGTSAEPTPLPGDPELVVDEDGCVTDVETGLVVTCHDPAAGPDEG